MVGAVYIVSTVVRIADTFGRIHPISHLRIVSSVFRNQPSVLSHGEMRDVRSSLALHDDVTTIPAQSSKPGTSLASRPPTDVQTNSVTEPMTLGLLLQKMSRFFTFFPKSWNHCPANRV